VQVRNKIRPNAETLSTLALFSAEKVLGTGPNLSDLNLRKKVWEELEKPTFLRMLSTYVQACKKYEFVIMQFYYQFLWIISANIYSVFIIFLTEFCNVVMFVTVNTIGVTAS
jgi:hypothetical protein